MSLEHSNDARPGIVGSETGITITYAKKLRRINLLRLLVTKIVFLREQVTFEEIVVFYDNLLWCLEFCQRQPHFAAKFGRSLEELARISRLVKWHPDLISENLGRLAQELRPLENFYIPLRNFQGNWRYAKGLFHVTSKHREMGRLTKTLPPKPYIGVGYKDKGTRRDTAQDGSPSWQEVAMDRRGER